MRKASFRLTLVVMTVVSGMSFICLRPHPFYLSVTELRYDAGEKAYQGSIRVFTNDLEDALSRESGKKADLLNAADTSWVIAAAAGYLNARFRFFSDGKEIKWRLIGFENEEEATWFYIELAPCAPPNKVRIINRVLCDYLKSQMNIVHLEVGGIRKSGRINCPDEEIFLEF